MPPAIVRKKFRQNNKKVTTVHSPAEKEVIAIALPTTASTIAKTSTSSLPGTQNPGGENSAAADDLKNINLQTQSKSLCGLSDSTRPAKIVVHLPLCPPQTSLRSEIECNQDTLISLSKSRRHSLKAEALSTKAIRKTSDEIQHGYTHLSRHPLHTGVASFHVRKAEAKKSRVKMDNKTGHTRGRGPVRYGPQSLFPPTSSHILDGSIVTSFPSHTNLPLESHSQPNRPPRSYQTSKKNRAIPTPANPQHSPQSKQKVNQARTMALRTQDAQYRPDWKEWTEVAVKVTGLPRDLHITTRDLWATFKSQGQISTIELGDNGKRDGTALVRFSPPPHEAFWATPTFRIILSNTSPVTFYAHVQLEPTRSRRQKFVHPTPKSKLQYPEIMTLIAETLDFGFMYQRRAMMTMCTVKSKEPHNVIFRLNLHRRELEVTFAIAARDSRKQGRESQGKDDMRVLSFRYAIPLDQLAIINETVTSDRVIWMLSIENPPRFYWKGDEGRSFPTNLEDKHAVTSWNQRDAWYRRTDICFDRSGVRSSPLALRKFNPIIDIGRWTTYRFCLLKNDAGQNPYVMMREALKEHNVQFEPLDCFEFVPKEEPIFWTYLDEMTVQTTFASNDEAVDEQNPPEDRSNQKLAFSVRYQLEVCLSQGCLNEHNLTTDVVDQLMETNTKTALDILERIANLGKRVYEPLAVLENYLSLSSAPRTQIPTYCALIRSATVTPTMVYYNTPTVETSNRVIRQFAGHGDRFLRVRFTDEKNEGKIYSSDNDTNVEVFTRIKRTMAHGILVGGRHFEFLAFGNSQFREHGAYFFARLPNFGPEHIRMWMGDFSDIRIVAKYAARLGQCFSTTRAINGYRVTLVEDVDVKDKGGHTFTDGVGKISQHLARLAAEELGFFPNIPSAYQFRLGGCKGVLTAWPELDDHAIHIRPSQYKFAANHEGLEINRWSQFGGAFLNRQIISVLSALGVPDKVFTDKMIQQLSDLANAMTDSRLSLHLLQKAIDANQMTLALASMVIDGFQDTREPFTVSLLHLWRAWSTKYLKEKAKLFVPEGAFLLGCTDETRTLQGHFVSRQVGKSAQDEDRLRALPEVFVQISKGEDDPPQIITGPISLARNPSLHPGDIRVVLGVDNPKLHHLVNVVVLPQTGDRDLASMCSGGDLDGDDYLVMWDQALLPKDWNEEPMDYSAPPPLKLGRGVVMEDIHSFFVEHMKMDNLGKIATAHLAISDLSPLGVKDRKCMQLARLHSMAVDYAKTGIPAVLSKDLIPRNRPHFMEPKRKEPYHSSKILGQLYDQVESIDFVPKFDAPFDKRILNAHEVDEQILTDARTIKKQYDVAMHRIMAQHDIRTEFEVWSTFVLHHANQNGDYKFHEEIGQLSTALKDQFRTACYQKAGGKEFEDIGPFAVAMYAVTSEEVQQAVHECRQHKIIDGQSIPVRQSTVDEMPLMSFPWIFASVLGRLATGESSAPHAVQAERKRAVRKAPVHSSLIDDTLQTAEGETHRGELLELFQHDGINVEEPQRREPMDGKASLNISPTPPNEIHASSYFMSTRGNESMSSSSQTAWADLEGLDISSSNRYTPESQPMRDNRWAVSNDSETLNNQAMLAELTSTTDDAYDGLDVFESLAMNGSRVTPCDQFEYEQDSCTPSMDILAQSNDISVTPVIVKLPSAASAQTRPSTTFITQSRDVHQSTKDKNRATSGESSGISIPGENVRVSPLNSAFPLLPIETSNINGVELSPAPLVPSYSTQMYTTTEDLDCLDDKRNTGKKAMSYAVNLLDDSTMNDDNARSGSQTIGGFKPSNVECVGSVPPLNFLVDNKTSFASVKVGTHVLMQGSPERHITDMSAEGDPWGNLMDLEDVTEAFALHKKNVSCAQGSRYVTSPLPPASGNAELDLSYLDSFESMCTVEPKNVGDKISTLESIKQRTLPTNEYTPSFVDLLDTSSESTIQDPGSPFPQADRSPVSFAYRPTNSTSGSPLRREEGECPHCHYNFPPKGADVDGNAREAHITSCPDWEFSALDTFSTPRIEPSGHRTTYSGSFDLMPDLAPKPIGQSTASDLHNQPCGDGRERMSGPWNELVEHKQHPSPTSDCAEVEMEVTLELKPNRAWQRLYELTRDDSD